MKTIFAFSKYINRTVGGAELSMHNILKRKHSLGYKIQLISFKKNGHIGKKIKNLDFKLFKVQFIKNLITLSRFSFIEYVLNRKKVITYFSKLDEKSKLLTYALYAPAAIIGYRGESTYYIRSESDLSIYKNYHTGFLRLIKYIYMMIEYPAFLIYKIDIEKAIQKAKVVSNSQFSAELLKHKYNVTSKVSLPEIDLNQIKNIELKASKEKGIVFIGDSVVKGLSTVKKISKRINRTQLFIFSRKTKQKITIDNISWMPWQKNSGDIYKYANLVIVPSIWFEFYGRVAREAYLLNIPILVSNIGGLPEAVDFKKEYLVNDYKNINEWVTRINRVIKNVEL